MAEYLGVVVPAPATLARYGLSLGEWRRMNRRARGCCEVCGRPPKNKRLNIDHEHVPGWRKMPPAKRKLYVRGLVCTIDNHYVLTKYADALRHRQAANYLARYERRSKRRQR